MTPTSPIIGLEGSIREICASHPVMLAYLFGSHARSSADAESDIDIAVLADASLSKDERLDLRFRLRIALAESLRLDLEMIDIIVLQDVPILLQYNVIRTGRVLYARDANTRSDFQLRVEQLYEDEAPYLERESAITLQRILARRSV